MKEFNDRVIDDPMNRRSPTKEVFFCIAISGDLILSVATVIKGKSERSPLSDTHLSITYHVQSPLVNIPLTAQIMEFSTITFK